MTDSVDSEKEHVLERIEQIDEDIETLQQHPMVEGYRANYAMEMARGNLRFAYRDVAGSSEDS